MIWHVANTQALTTSTKNNDNRNKHCNKRVDWEYYLTTWENVWIIFLTLLKLVDEFEANALTFQEPSIIMCKTRIINKMISNISSSFEI